MKKSNKEQENTELPLRINEEVARLSDNELMIIWIGYMTKLLDPFFDTDPISVKIIEVIENKLTEKAFLKLESLKEKAYQLDML